MKNILRAAIQRIEHALDSGLLISEEFEQALLLDERFYVRREQLDGFPTD